MLILFLARRLKLLKLFARLITPFLASLHVLFQGPLCLQRPLTPFTFRTMLIRTPHRDLRISMIARIPTIAKNPTTERIIPLMKLHPGHLHLMTITVPPANQVP